MARAAFATSSDARNTSGVCGLEDNVDAKAKDCVKYSPATLSTATPPLVAVIVISTTPRPSGPESKSTSATVTPASTVATSSSTTTGTAEGPDNTGGVLRAATRTRNSAEADACMLSTRNTPLANACATAAASASGSPSMSPPMPLVAAAAAASYSWKCTTSSPSNE